MIVSDARAFQSTLKMQIFGVGTKPGVGHGLGHGVGHGLPVVNFPKNQKN